MAYVPVCEFCFKIISGSATELMVGERFQHLGLVCDKCMREEFPKHDALKTGNPIIAALYGS
jgi:hypothetical protein